MPKVRKILYVIDAGEQDLFRSRLRQSRKARS